MFGRPSFGVSQPTTFGFGSTPNAPFGQTSQLFGNTSGSFGSSSSGFGSATPSMFGTPQQPAAPLFGSSSTSTFGQANQTGFGSALFGNTAQQPSSSGLFGNSGNSSFGQQNKSAGFGFSSGASSGLFGQTATQTAPNSSMFQPSNALFGNTSTFGGATGQNGTVIKFSPVTGTDSMQKSGVSHTISTKHHCITCMKEYENKSLEELRWEDYQANRKGPQQQPGFGSSQPFGVTASAAPTLFGQTDNKTVFGQTAPGFGQPTGFGLASQSTTSNIFGKPAVSGFGATTTASNAFGFGTNTSTTGGLFGTNTPKFAPSNQSLFGAAQPQQNTFGNANLFGQPSTQSSGGLFGKQVQPTGFNSFSFGTGQQNLFQNPKPNTASPFNIFGQTPTTNTGFGQQQPQQQTNFGFMPFGKPPQNTFGQPNVFGLGGGNLFGNATTKPSGLFGNNTTSNFFGNNNFQPNSGFIMPNQMLPMIPNQTAVPTTEYIDLGSILQVTDPYGYNPHLEGLSPLKSTEPVPYTTNPSELQKLLDTPQRIAVISPITKRMKVLPRTTHKVNVFDDIADKNTTEVNFGLKTTAKRLVLKKDKHSPPSAVRESTNDVTLPPINVEDADPKNDVPGARKVKSGNKPNFVPASMTFSISNDIEDDFVDKCENISNNVENDVPKLSNNTNPAVGIANDDVLTTSLERGDVSAITETPENGTIDTCGVIMTRPEYYTVPTLDKLIEYTQPDGTCLVRGFTIGRIGFGSVSFPDLIDVTDLNIDELVHFRYRELTIYPDDTKKPPLGQGLNRRAQVTLDRVYPKDKIERTLITDVDTLVSINFIDTLRDLCEKHGTKFLDYRPDTGSWVFTVEHFSKYGFSDSEEETDNEKIIKQKQDKKKPKDKKSAEKKKLFEVKKSLEEKIIQDEINEALLIVDKEHEKYLYDEDLEIRSGLGGFSEIGDDIEDIDIELARGINLHSVTSRRSLYNTGGSLLHVMKATLFDEEYIPDPDFPNLEIFDDESRLFEELLSTESQLEIAQVEKPVFQKPDMFALCNKFGDIPKNKYLFHSRSYMDVGIFKHKSFKVGWGRGFTLATTLPPSNNRGNFVNDAFIEHCPTIISIIDVAELVSRDIYTDSLTEHLRIVLEESNFTLIDGVPLFKVKDGESMLLRHQLLATESAEISNNKEAQYYKEIWNLCLAFWGPITKPTRRKDLFSEWLEDVSRDKIHEELNVCSKDDNSTIQENIFINLTGHQILEASNIAMNNKMPKLSLLLSQLNLNESSKLYMNEQLEQWKFATSFDHMNLTIKKIYMTISGMSVNGLSVVNICENLDWKRALAMFLWYVIPEPSLLREAVLLYQEAFTTYGYVSRPKSKHVNDNRENIFDIQYYLMLLFCKSKQALEDILNPHTHTDYQADYRLSWLLLQTLNSLGVGVMSNKAKDYTTTSFAQQLENMGHYNWTVFVLLFIEDNSLKKNLIMGVLDRTLKFDLSNIEIEDEIVQDFSLPSEWIHIVKANKTNMLSNNWETYRHLSYSNKWYECHEMAINHILSDLIINEDYEPMTDILDTLDQGKEQIINWNYQAGLLIEFLSLLDTFRNENEITTDVTLHIHNNLVALCTKLKVFPRNSSKQIACISEVSKHCAIFIRIILKYMDPSYKVLKIEDFVCEEEASGNLYDHLYAVCK